MTSKDKVKAQFPRARAKVRFDGYVIMAATRGNIVLGRGDTLTAAWDAAAKHVANLTAKQGSAAPGDDDEAPSK